MTEPPILDGYAVDALVGVGPTGEVWRGRELATGEPVAIKRLRVGDPELADRLRRELTLLGAIAGPHLIGLRRVLDGDPVVLVLDYAAGGNLASVLGVRGRLPAAEVVTVLAPLAAALAAGHDRDLVHGGLSPANVVFSADGRPLLTDYGLAAAFVAAGAVTSADDVYALGAIGYTALAGRPPDGSLLAALAPDAPAGLIVVIESMLASEPGERPPARLVARSVLRACDPAPIVLVRRTEIPQSPSPQPPDWPSSDSQPPSLDPPDREPSDPHPDPPLSDPPFSDQHRVPLVPTGLAERLRAMEVPTGPVTPRPARVGIARDIMAVSNRPVGEGRNRPVVADRARAVGAASARGSSRQGAGRSRSNGAGRSRSNGAGRSRSNGAGRSRSNGALRRRSMARKRSRRRWPRRLASIATTVAACAVLVAIYRQPQRADDTAAVPTVATSPVATSPVATQTAATQPIRTPSAPTMVPPLPADASSRWTSVVTRLDDARARAFDQAEPSILADVYVPGSAAYLADQATVSSLAGRGLHARGFAATVEKVSVQASTPTTEALRVIDRLSAYSLVDASGEVVGHGAARSPRAFTMDLTRVAGSWRVAAVHSGS